MCCALIKLAYVAGLWNFVVLRATFDTQLHFTAAHRCDPEKEQLSRCAFVSCLHSLSKHAASVSPTANQHMSAHILDLFFAFAGR